MRVAINNSFEDNSVDVKQILVDVTVLSKGLCKFPIQCKLAYATVENFLGRIVDGYHPQAQDICLLTRQVALSLCSVQQDLNEKGLGLYVYDAYRPLRAVKDFLQWTEAPVVSSLELECKKIYYPHIDKKDFNALGYVATTVSKHNFGNAVDLTVINLQTMKLLEMGACFDCFDEVSHHTATAKDIGQVAYNNRQLLVNAMAKHGFTAYVKEFWHFDYRLVEVQSPIDIPIEPELRGLNC